MITFTFDYETHDNDGTLKDRPIWWLGSTDVTDKEDQDEIYEAIAAHESYLDE